MNNINENRHNPPGPAHHHVESEHEAYSTRTTKIRRAFEGATTQDTENFQRTKDEDISSIKLYFVPSKWMSRLLQYIDLHQKPEVDHLIGAGGHSDNDDPMEPIPFQVNVVHERVPVVDNVADMGTAAGAVAATDTPTDVSDNENDVGIGVPSSIIGPVPAPVSASASASAASPDRIENMQYLRCSHVRSRPQSHSRSRSRPRYGKVHDNTHDNGNEEEDLTMNIFSSSPGGKSIGSDGSSESARAKRAARREKWKAREIQQNHDQNQEGSRSRSRSNSSTNITDKTLRSGLRYGEDYVLVGEGLWTLISSKFGYDVIIDFQVKVVDDPDYSNSAGDGNREGKATRRVVQVYNGYGNGSWVDLPSNGAFDYPSLAQQHLNAVGTRAELISDDGNGIGSSNHGSDDADAIASLSKVDDDLWGDPVDDEDDTPNNQIILLPPSSTTSQPSACRSLVYSDMVMDSDPAKSDDPNSDDDNSANIKTNVNVASSSLSLSPSSNPRKRKRYGSGLGNLGNTCFMNSTLQCLAHTGPLRSYFLSGEYASDLNCDNPLGTGGELATEFAKLLSEMWGTNSDTSAGNASTLRNSNNVYGYRRSWTPHNNSSSVVYPRDFKYTLGKHAEQFMGYNQHDSQELATYLLDALHEDTNRVSKKPYVEKPEQGEDECDEVAANKAWALHLKREDSRVLESFMGQVKSRVECPIAGCGRVSTTFDPFMYLSIPLPGATERTIEVTFVPISSDNCRRKFHVTVSKNALIKDLQKKTLTLIQESYSLGELDLDAKNLVIGEVFQQEIYMFYSEMDEVSRLREADDIYAFQVASVESIHDEQEEAKEKCKAKSPIGETTERSSTQKLKLDVATITKLNRDWEDVFSSYLSQSTTLPALLNPRRHTHEDRMNFHQKVNNFINRCYASPECIAELNPATSSTLSQSDTELESCDDGSDSENDGKSSPTTHVANKLGATVVDDNAQLLEELCDIFKTFKDVRTPQDVASLEFCNKKLYQHSMNKMNESKIKYKDGAEIQVTFRSPNVIGSGERKMGSPFILRISPTLTVYELRKMLASRLGPYLNTTNIDAKVEEQSSGDSSKESKDELMTHDESHRNSDFLLNDDCGEELRILRQISLTYERKHATNSYHMKPSSNRKLGSISHSEKSSFSHHSSVSFAMPNDEAESESVLEIVGKNGKVQVHLPSNDVFDEEKWSHHECEGTHQKDGEKEQDITVLDCIRKYCEKEQLQESEMWYCNKCKEHVQAWKQFHLYRTPPILIVHLKRFHYSPLTHRRDKIDLFVDFPLKGLDLRKEVMYWDEGEEPIYDCYAVSNHFGGLGGGHYTAYAINDEGEWCNFDDSRVSTNVDESEVVSSAAYVLYYRRHDVKVDDQVWTDRPLPSLNNVDANPSKQMDIEGSSTDGLLTSSTPTCPSPIGSLDDICDEEMVDPVDTVFDPVDI